MAFAEKPPILTGNSRTDLNNLRDYLFRLAGNLSEAATAPEAASNGGVSISYRKDGQQVLTPNSDAEALRRNASELKSLILKSANEVRAYTDSKTEEYNEMYLARSEFGDFQENIDTMITTSARGVVESYNYTSSIRSLQDSIDLLQGFKTVVNGEIRRGIVQIPGTNPAEYELGIAIAQNLNFEEGQSYSPGDGYTYYYISAGQTFGLYTSHGWQFWVNGEKRGWYDSEDNTQGMLHVSGALVESALQIGARWELVSDPGTDDLELRYLGGT